MRVAVVGTGYVGLVTGTCLAEVGNDVSCVDIDAEKVARMKAGKVPIYEPGLEIVFKRNIEAARLHFATDLQEGIAGAEVIFLALPTPPGDDGSADLSYILDVAGKLGKLLKTYTVIVDKSTVPVGTAEKVRALIAKDATVQFDVISNPEFLREGHALADSQHPERIVIGTSSQEARDRMEELYAPFVQVENSSIIFMDETSAELTKYAANSFLALKISFMNEIACLAEQVGANVDAIRRGVGTDSRIGDAFLHAGIGFGGSCFPKDIKAIRHIAKENKYTFRTMEAVAEVNAQQKKLLPEKISRYYKGTLKGKRFALWGLAFKPDTDDIREAPALDIIQDLTSAGATVVAYDPEAMDNFKKHHSTVTGLSFANSSYKALDGADALLIATEWAEFRNPDLGRIKKALKEPVIFDGRNLYELEEMRGLGFYYESIGRPVITN